MKTVQILSQEDTVRFQAAALKISEGNRQTAAAKKLVDAGKDFVSKWLEENRLIVLKDLPVGETVLVKCQGVDVLRIAIKKQNRLDAKALEMDKPDVAAAFKKDFPMVCFESLVEDVVTP